ncbi:hypothetical protein PGTUg99_022148 [Puccinia graminis f. sp. tritici]|uniref:Uncharacterized protein n=1 Tax=Puccinia graminis f. sp. tritici TaxID=56615 RepID=A0A5B0PNR8_PUCGR|nr:hypothetical protein PGTUg99_022148 [Puccinia graminis f. sp. tritici]
MIIWFENARLLIPTAGYYSSIARRPASQNLSNQRFRKDSPIITFSPIVYPSQFSLFGQGIKSNNDLNQKEVKSSKMATINHRSTNLRNDLARFRTFLETIEAKLTTMPPDYVQKSRYDQGENCYRQGFNRASPSKASEKV